MSLLGILQTIQLVTMLNVPAGSQLRVRMDTAVASWSTAVDTPIHAVLIAPVIVKGQIAVPAGCTLTGRVRSVTRVGLGIRHERASLGLEFFSVALPGENARALETRVTEVDNSRERVGTTGLVQGVRATNSIAYRVSGYIKMALLWHFHAEIAGWAIKSLVVQLPEPEIYYPAGTELTLALTRQIVAPAGFRAVQEIAQSEAAVLERAVASLPFRTTDSKSGRPSDLVNVMFSGNRGEILAGFAAAGWSPAHELSVRSRIGVIRAAAELRGYASPMNPLSLNGKEADLTLQKGLNDVSKRHHIRIWKQPGMWEGKELWMAAATRDVDYAYLRPGSTFSHHIDPNVDEERDKVVYDLAFTTCAVPVGWMDRPGVPREARNGTGDAIVTDARMAVIRFQECSAVVPAPGSAEPALVTRGGKWQRLLRREILITRNDLLRANPYWRIYEGGFRMLSCVRRRNPDALFETPLLPSPRMRSLSMALNAFQ